MSLSKIIEGWRNHILPPSYLKGIINRASQERLSICEGCPHNSRWHSIPLRPDEHCTICGCTLVPKTKCLSCACPDNPPRWAPLTTSEEEELIKKENEKDIDSQEDSHI